MVQGAGGEWRTAPSWRRITRTRQAPTRTAATITATVTLMPLTRAVLPGQRLEEVAPAAHQHLGHLQELCARTAQHSTAQQSTAQHGGVGGRAVGVGVAELCLAACAAQPPLPHRQSRWFPSRPCQTSCCSRRAMQRPTVSACADVCSTALLPRKAHRAHQRSSISVLCQCAAAEQRSGPRQRMCLFSAPRKAPRARTENTPLGRQHVCRELGVELVIYLHDADADLRVRELAGLVQVCITVHSCASGTRITAERAHGRPGSAAARRPGSMHAHRSHQRPCRQQPVHFWAAAGMGRV